MQHFNPKPWRMASQALRDMGYDEEANKLAIRRRVNQRFASNTTIRSRIVNLLLQWIAEYGYNP